MGLIRIVLFVPIGVDLSFLREVFLCLLGSELAEFPEAFARERDAQFGFPPVSGLEVKYSGG